MRITGTERRKASDVQMSALFFFRFPENIFRNFLTFILKNCDKNFERLQKVRYITIIDEVKSLNGQYFESVYHLDYRDYECIEQGIICSDSSTHCVILRDARSDWGVSEGFISERMDVKRDTIRYIGRKKSAYGTVITKTVIFAGNGIPGERILNDYYDIFAAEQEF